MVAISADHVSDLCQRFSTVDPSGRPAARHPHLGARTDETLLPKRVSDATALAQGKICAASRQESSLVLAVFTDLDTDVH